MIKHLVHTEIDKVKWDETINASVNSIIYAKSGYLDAVCPGWEALIVDDYKQVMPLTARKKIGVDYLFQPNFAQQLGVFSPETIQPKDIEAFLNGIPERFSFVEVNINAGNILPEETTGIKRRTNILLALAQPYERLKSAYSDNTKRNLKKAVKAGLQLRWDNSDTEAIINLFQKNKAAEADVPDDYIDDFRKVLDVCEEHTEISVYAGNELLSGAFFLHSKGRYVFIFSGNSEKGKEVGAMPYLIDGFIQKHAGEEALLDFEGSDNPNLARFYKGFGGVGSVYLQLRKNDLPWYIRWLKK